MTMRQFIPSHPQFLCNYGVVTESGWANQVTARFALRRMRALAYGNPLREFENRQNIAAGNHILCLMVVPGTHSLGVSHVTALREQIDDPLDWRGLADRQARSCLFL